MKLNTIFISIYILKFVCWTDSEQFHYFFFKIRRISEPVESWFNFHLNECCIYNIPDTMDTKNNKTCKNCKKNLDQSDFSGRRSICKKCKNQIDRDGYQQRKKRLEQISEFDDHIKLKSIIKIHMLDFIELLDKDISYEEINKKFSIIKDRYRDFKKDMKKMVIKVNVPEIVQEFCKNCKQIDAAPDEMIRQFVMDGPSKELIPIFGIIPEESMDEIFDWTDDLKFLTRAIDGIYAYIYQKSPEYIISNKQPTFVGCYFDSDMSCFRLNNILGMSRIEFYEKIQEVLKEPLTIGDLIMGYQNNGYYDKLFQIIA